MATITTPTVAELGQQLLDAPDDGCRYEIVHNQLVAMSPSERDSSAVAAWLTTLLGQVVAADQLGSLTSPDGAYTLSGEPDVNIRAPDVAFVRRGRVPPRSQRGPFPELAPDLVVQVRSPTDRLARVLEKIGQYLDAGVRVVWDIDVVHRRVSIYTTDAVVRTLEQPADVLAASEVIPGFSVTLAQLFRPFGEDLE